jgi:hypothetical protein
MARVPLRFARTVGLNVTSTVHDAAVAREAPQVLAAMAKSPGSAPPIAMLAMVKMAVPVLVRVTRRGALVARSLTGPTFRTRGLSCATGAGGGCVVADAAFDGCD